MFLGSALWAFLPSRHSSFIAFYSWSVIHNYRHKLDEPSHEVHQLRCGWCYLFTVWDSGLLFLHVLDLVFLLPVSLSAEKGTFLFCDLELWSMTLTYILDLDLFKTNYRTKCVGQRSFHSTVIIRMRAKTHTDTHMQRAACSRPTWRGTVVERWSLAGELSMSCARPAADGWPLMWVNRPLQVSQLGQLSLSSFRCR